MTPNPKPPKMVNGDTNLVPGDVCAAVIYYEEEDVTCERVVIKSANNGRISIEREHGTDDIVYVNDRPYFELDLGPDMHGPRYRGYLYIIERPEYGLAVVDGGLQIVTITPNRVADFRTGYTLNIIRQDIADLECFSCGSGSFNPELSNAGQVVVKCESCSFAWKRTY